MTSAPPTRTSLRVLIYQPNFGEVGAYSVSNSYLDIVLMLGFGVSGYLFKKLNYPLAPLVLAIVIGDKAEDAFRQSMLMSKGSLGIFFANKLVTCLVVGGIALLLLPLVLQLARPFRKTTSPNAETPAQEKVII